MKIAAAAYDFYKFYLNVTARTEEKNMQTYVNNANIFNSMS